MAENTNVTALSTQGATVVRRGVANARGTSRLKFSHEDVNKATGLFLAHLDTVDVSTIKIGEDKQGMPSFNGLEIPKLRFTFASNEDIVTKRKYITLQFNAVESNKDTIPGGKDEWKVDQVFNWIKHILKVYVCKGKELEEVFTPEQLAGLDLAYVDFDEQGAYNPVDPELVVYSWKTVFDNVENIINRGNNGTPYYLKDGKIIPTWIKLIRCTKSKSKGWVNVNNGDLSFPTFIGEGCIELVIPNVKPSIHLDMIKESIIAKVADQPKAPTNLTAPMINGMAAHMGGVVADGGFNSTEGFTDSPFMEDMPEF